MNAIELPQDQEPCIVASCKCGGSVLLIVKQRIEAQERQQLGALAADGYTIREVPVSEARGLPFGCQCKADSAQGQLL